MSEKKIPRCFKCHEIVTFDNEHIGKSGKKIPLDPETNEPHQCKPEVAATVGYTKLGEPITAQEASHEDPLVVEVKDKPRYPRHRIAIIQGITPEALEIAVNERLGENDNNGYNHRGVSFPEGGNKWVACIHYEILQPRDERLK